MAELAKRSELVTAKIRISQFKIQTDINHYAFANK